MPAEYAFDQLMGFSDLQKFGRFAYSARFAYTRIGNSPPPLFQILFVAAAYAKTNVMSRAWEAA